MTTIKLAEALLRRKELQQKVEQLRTIKQSDVIEIKVKRQKVSDDIDDIVAAVPKVTMAEVTKAYDYYAKRLRLIDGIIQQANWTTELNVEDSIMVDPEP